MTEKINILLVDDHPLVRDGLRARLEAVAHFDVVAEAGGADEALNQARAHQEDQPDRSRRNRRDARPRCGEVRDQIGDRQHHHDHADVEVGPQMMQGRQLGHSRMGLRRHRIEF